MTTLLSTITTMGFLQALSIVANAARAKVIAVLLGPEGVGVVGIVDQVVLVVVNISSLSLPFSALPFLSRSYGQGRAVFEQTYVRFFTVVVVCATAGTAVAVAIVGMRSGLLNETLLRYHSLLIIGLLSVPALAVISLGANTIAAARRPWQSGVVVAGTATAIFLAAVVGISTHALVGVYWANLLASVVVAGTVIGYLRRHLGLPLWKRRARIVNELTRADLAFFCVSYSVVSFAYPVAWLIARYAVLHQFGEAEAGRLHAVLALMLGFGAVLRPVNSQLLLPIVSSPGATDRKFCSTVEVQRRLTVALALLALPLVLFPEWLLTALYSTAFRAASHYVHLFIVAEMILILGGTYQALVLGLNDVRAWAFSYVLGYAWLGGMSWALGTAYGLPGVAVAAMSAGVLVFVLGLWRLQSHHGFRLPADLLRMTALVGVSILAVGEACARYDDGSVTVLFVKIVALLVSVPGLVGCLDREDREWVYRHLTRSQWRST